MGLKEFLLRFLRPAEPPPALEQPPLGDCDPAPGYAVPGYAVLPCLTPREVQVARLIREGLSNDAIALRLGVSVGTVKSHVHHLLVKFNVRSRYVLREWLDTIDFEP